MRALVEGETMVSGANATLAARRAEAISGGVGIMNHIYVQRGRNAEVWDVEGKRFIDFAAGIAVMNTGHCHPKIVEAVHRQVDAFSHTCHHVLPYENYVELAERLNTLVPGDFRKKTAFFSTGAEGVENAIKIARASTKRHGVVAFGGGFHGRTYLGLSLTGKLTPYKADFGPMAPHIYHLPFPNDVHGGTTDDTIKAAEKLFRESISADQIAAIIIEPVQGEGGFYSAPAKLMRWLRSFCDTHSIVMIADEVQSGFARTGKLFAMEHFGVSADLTVMAKGIAGGFPLSAVTGRAEFMDAARPGGIGGTYGGNPVGIAAALAVLNVVENEKLCARANELGSRLRQRLARIGETCPELKDIRGLGFMVAAEFMKADGQTPNAPLVAEIRAQARARGLILLSCGVYDNAIRFLAPLTIQTDVFEEALDIIAASIEAARTIHA